MNLSDVDVKMRQLNDSQNLSGSFNMSMDGGNADINDRYYKQSGSPRPSGGELVRGHGVAKNHSPLKVLPRDFARTKLNLPFGS